MEKATVIKELIDKKGMSINAFAREINMSPSTLHSILDRGAGRASVDNIIKICYGLGITCDELEKIAKGTKFQSENNEEKNISTIAAHHDAEEFTEEELESIETFKEFIRQKKENKK